MAKKILLVDDEADTAMVFQTALRQGGYEVTVANSAQAALSTAQTAQFDLILLDQMMPDMSGNDALQLLKSKDITKNIPVAMLTNFSHDELVTQALERGAVDYILKYQVANEDLVNKVKGILGD